MFPFSGLCSAWNVFTRALHHASFSEHKGPCQGNLSGDLPLWVSTGERAQEGSPFLSALLGMTLISFYTVAMLPSRENRDEKPGFTHHHFYHCCC